MEDIEVTLLGQPYSLRSGKDAINMIALLCDTTNRIASDLTKIGGDTLENARRQREAAEWLRRNVGAGAAALGGGAGTTAAAGALALAGIGQTSQPTVQLPAATPTPQPQPQNPHKTAAPTLGGKAPSIVGQGGSIDFTTGTTPSDIAHQVTISAGAGAAFAQSLLVVASFGATFTKPPNVQISSIGAPLTTIYADNITPTSYELRPLGAINAGDVVRVQINVFPNPGDATY